MAMSQSEIRLLQRKADKYDRYRETYDKYHAVWHALDGLVNAWETLPGGRGHKPDAIERWLARNMSPAIDEARKALGRKAPNE